MSVLAAIAAAAVIMFAAVAPAHTMGDEQGGAGGGNVGGMMDHHRAMMEEHHGAIPDMGYYQERLMTLAERLKSGNLSQQDQIQMGEDLSQMAEAMEYHDMIGMSEDRDMGMSEDDGAEIE
jgi:hypothetical protein